MAHCPKAGNCRRAGNCEDKEKLETCPAADTFEGLEVGRDMGDVGQLQNCRQCRRVGSGPRQGEVGKLRNCRQFPRVRGGPIQRTVPKLCNCRQNEGLERSKCHKLSRRDSRVPRLERQLSFIFHVLVGFSWLLSWLIWWLLCWL